MASAWEYDFEWSYSSSLDYFPTAILSEGARRTCAGQTKCKTNDQQRSYVERGFLCLILFILRLCMHCENESFALTDWIAWLFVVPLDILECFKQAKAQARF